MKIETKKKIAENIRELYLYPYRTKVENLIRGGALISAWIIGVLFPMLSPKTLDNNALGGAYAALGGAYAVFSISLLLEFTQKSKNEVVPGFIHKLFLGMQYILFFGSLVLSFLPILISSFTGFVLSFAIKIELLCSVTSITIFIMILTSFFLSLFEVHKIFYNDIDFNTNKQIEELTISIREQFMKNVEGNVKEVKK